MKFQGPQKVRKLVPLYSQFGVIVSPVLIDHIYFHLIEVVVMNDSRVKRVIMFPIMS
jgi:hypothetical protein